jgi:hypothetical protein
MSTLEAVEVEQDPNGHPRSSSFTSSHPFSIAFLSFLVFEAVCASAALLFVSTTTIPYQISQDYSNRIAEVHILVPFDGFLSLQSSLTRFATEENLSNPISVNTTIDFLRGSRVIGRQEFSIETDYFFLEGSEESTGFDVFTVHWSYADRVNCSIVFQTDFHFCKRFNFRYANYGVRLTQFVNAVRLILSASAFYAFLPFVPALKDCVLLRSRLPSVVLGVSAMIGTNPVGVVFPWARLFDQIMAVLFLSGYRWFVVSYLVQVHQISIIRSVYVAIFAFGHAALEVLGQSPAVRPAVIERALIVAHWHCRGLFIMVVIWLLFWALCKGKREMLPRLAGFGASVVLALEITILVPDSRGIDSVHWTLLALGGHVFIAIVFLFMEDAPGAGYEAFAAEKAIADDRSLCEDGDD